MSHTHRLIPGFPRDRRRRMRHRISWVFLLGLLAAAGCGEPDPAASAPELSRSEFIDVVVALRSVEIELEAGVEDDSVLDARYEARKDSILDAHGVSAGELYAFLELHRDIQFQNELWDTITQRLKRPRPGPRGMIEPPPGEQDRLDPPAIPGREPPSRPPGPDAKLKR